MNAADARNRLAFEAFADQNGARSLAALRAEWTSMSAQQREEWWLRASKEITTESAA